MAWQHISPEVTEGSNALNGIGDDMLWNDGEEDGGVRGEWEEV